MPVYNGERFLRAAVESILQQSFHDFEFVVIDDGSTDSTPRMLAGIQDPRLKIFSLPHAGLVHALNEGIGRCRGDYIARMDADDLSHPNRLAREYEFLAAHPDVALVTCLSDLMDDAGCPVGRTTGGVSDDMILELAAGNSIVHGSIMVRRDSLPPAPVYVGPPEDYWLWVQMARAGKQFRCIPEVLYGFRTHGQRYSVTHARSQSAGIVEVQWPLLEECSSNRDMNRPEVRVRVLRGWGNVAGAAYCAGDRQRGDIARRRFLELANGNWDGEFAAAAGHGIEAMIWGGCPWPNAWRLRWLQWRHQPVAWASYRNLLLTLPPVRKLRAAFRRES